MAGCKTIKIKEGMPTVKQAEARLLREMDRAKKEGVSAIKIIHGYGSTGAGGRLRIGLREFLARQKKFGKISDFIPGEDFSIFNMPTIYAIDACEDLRRDSDLNRSNNGITIIVLLHTKPLK